MTGVTRGDGTEGGEEGKGGGGERGEEGGEETLAHGQVDQPKVIQEVLADLKMFYYLKQRYCSYLKMLHNLNN